MLFRSHPTSPYGAAKLYAHEVTRTFREAYGMFACAGILFNHESPLRSLEFVTRKISYTMSAIKLGFTDHVTLGNVHARRDWGYAKDYVEGMWLMLQREKPKDYILATGKTHSVEDFLRAASDALGLDYQACLRVDSNLFRPMDIDSLVGDPSEAEKDLGWSPQKTTFSNLVQFMVEADMRLLKTEKWINLERVKLLSQLDRKSTRLNSSHIQKSRMPSSA